MSVKPSQIVKFKGEFEKDRIRALFYGDSGVGKTVLCSTWEPPVLFLDIDKGLSSVRREVDQWPIETWDDLYEATAFLLQGEHEYRTVVVDSLNEVQHICMDNVIESYKAIKRSYDSLASVSDYGKMLSDFDDWVRVMKQLPIHVLLIAQVQQREFDTDPVMPQLVGKNTAANVCRMMDLVGYLYKSEGGDANGARMIAFNIAGYVCKDRSGTLPPSLEIQHRDKTYDQLRKYWE